ncbi:MAG TPA: TlpA disulfide reductase family protein [Flavobacterium sp.]
MKNLVVLFVLAFSGAFAQTDVVKFTAKIANRNSDSLVVRGPQKFMKVLRANKEGIFTDSFPVTTGPHQIFDGSEQTLVYLKNGFDLSLTIDAKQFDESIVYTGTGSAENNFLAQKMLSDEQFQDAMTSFSDEQAFSAALDKRSKALLAKLDNGSMDASFKAQVSQLITMEGTQMGAMFQSANANKKLIGASSPTFEYENHKGGKTKLSDLKGKYVYIDNWATWCGPCRAEIPHLKKVEEKYHGKKIEFVSISIDEQKDHEKWKQFVTDKQLGGVQLFADNAWSSEFMKAYGIQSIPRFILIGPDGKIVDPDAKRPSDPALQEQLSTLLK